MANHIVKHLEHEVGTQLDKKNQLVHIDENTAATESNQPRRLINDDESANS